MTVLLSLAVFASSALAVSCASTCPVLFDGRVPANATVKDFDSVQGGGWNPFNPDYVKGNDLLWSDIVQLPDVEEKSLFDAGAGTRPLEVTISDESIFQQQKGFRRAGLQFSQDSNSGSPGSQGVVTFHFSLRVDETRALNLSHEYLLVWHEAGDYSANQFNFNTGTLIGRENLAEPNTYKLLNRKEELLWETPILEGEWQNFGITLDFDENTIAAVYSTGSEPLTSALEATSNDNSGDGQYQFGLLKKPTGTDDVVNSGYQSSNLDEGLIYGGIFVEDSSGGCISTKAASRRLRFRRDA
ncbi:hypothetical protein LIA77_08823 [Sarocladium implicatum]|nr:hypothetical protein LIA77_08823 [Sarocladium implicatum]